MCDGHTLCMQHTWEAMLVSISHFSQNSNFAIRNTAMVQSALFSEIFTILGIAAPLSAFMAFFVVTLKDGLLSACLVDESFQHC